MSPLISVVMGVYNGGGYLREAVDSILDQTFTDFEFIIIDDGSIDDTKAILESYNDDRIVLVHQENIGLTKALNKGLSIAKGKFIARQDADDISHPERFERQVRYMQENSDCLVLGTWMDVIDENGLKYNTFRYPEHFADIREAMKRYDPIGHGTIMARTSALVENCGYNEKFYYAQDYDFWLRLSEVGELRNLPEELYSLRLWPGSISISRGHIQMSFANIARQDALSRRYQTQNKSIISGSLDKDTETRTSKESKNSGSKIKILYVSHSSGIAGAENSLLNLLTFLDKSSFIPVVVLPSIGPLNTKIESIGIKTYITPLEWNVSYSIKADVSGNKLKQRVNDLVQIMKAEKPDIVHTNTSVIWEGALAAKVCGVPHVWHVHENLSKHPSLSSLIPVPLHYWIMDELSEKVVVVSDYLKNKLEPFIVLGKLLTIYSGIDEEEFRHLPENSIRKRLAISEGVPVAVTLGSLIPEKGYDVLLTAAYFCKKRGCKVKFLIAGTGSTEAVQSLLDQIERLDLIDTVYYLGFREDIPQIISSSDFLVIPSLLETFSLAALEAMASCKPVIATDCGGPSEIIAHDETGFLVPINDPLALCQKIVELSENDEKSKAMGINAFNRFIANFSAQAYSGKYEDLYNQIAKIVPKSSIANKYSILLDSCQDLYQSYLEKISRYNTMSQALDDLNLQLSDRNTKLARAEQEIAERDLLCATSSQQLIDHTHQLAKSVQQLAVKNQELMICQQHIAEGESRLALMAIRNSELMDEVTGLRNSQSWKITKPLRLLCSFFIKRYKSPK
jgi:glycosyltransferase involved in cell wall biosynthesis